jgi:hypothetical protein
VTWLKAVNFAEQNFFPTALLFHLHPRFFLPTSTRSLIDFCRALQFSFQKLAHGKGLKFISTMM